MITENNTFAEIRNLITKVSSGLVKMGRREDADALSTLTQVIGYRVGDHFTEVDEAADNYKMNLNRLKVYLDKALPSPSDSAEK